MTVQQKKLIKKWWSESGREIQTPPHYICEKCGITFIGRHENRPNKYCSSICAIKRDCKQKDETIYLLPELYEIVKSNINLKQNRCSLEFIKEIEPRPLQPWEFGYRSARVYYCKEKGGECK